MKNDIYLNCKAIIKEVADREHRDNPRDKARVRSVLNDELDSLIRQIDFHVLRDRISTPLGELYKLWLTSYTIKRHEK